MNGRQARTRDTQTEIKHELMADYLERWAGIIINGLAGAARRVAAGGGHFRAHFFYVDTCSFVGRYTGDTDEVLLKGAAAEPRWGSPVLGVAALDRARVFAAAERDVPIGVTAILFEQERPTYEALVANLREAGFGPRLVEGPAALAARDGAIVVINGDYLAHREALLALLADRYHYGFVLADPYGPTGIPYETIGALARLRGVDVMINMPMYDLYKKASALGAEGIAPAVFANYDAMYGTAAWRELAEGRWGRALEDALARFYLERLRAADPALAVKHIRLHFPDRARTMYYLFLTTHDPTGALKLNQVIHDAGLTEHERRWDLQQAQQTVSRGEVVQLRLFDMAPKPPPAPERLVDIERLADYLWSLGAGRELALRDLYAALANNGYWVDEVQRALRALRRRGAARFSDPLRNDRTIAFDPWPDGRPRPDPAGPEIVWAW